MGEPIHTYPGCAISSCEGIGLLVWTGEPTLAANQWAVRTLLAHRASAQREVTLLQIITEQAGTPGAEARAYIQDVYERELSDVRRMVTAPLGDSFRQSIIRTILRGMALLAGKTRSVRIVATLDEAYAAVLADRTSPTREALDRQVRAMLEAARTA